MRAVLIERTDSGVGLVLGEAPEPALGAGQVRIAVRAVSVNYADLLVPLGGYGRVPDPDVAWVAGLDAAGEVTAVADGVATPRVGDRVMTTVAGGLAEEIVVDARCTLPVPTSWTNEEGAAAIVGLLTEHDALTDAGGLRPGESVLITGATSGVGLQGVQLARHLGAGPVIAVARSDRADAVLSELGADLVLHSDGGDFAAAVRAATDGAGADVAVDHVGGAYFPELVRSAAIAGRIVNVGRAAGGEATLDLETVSLNRLQVRGVTFRTRSADQVASVYAGVRALDLEASAAALRPIVHRVLPWDRTEEAQRLLGTSSVIGKVVVRVGD